MSKKKLAKPFELPRTFFNQNLVEVDPFQLRDELFSRHETEFSDLFANLLDAIEREARELLKKNPPPAPFDKYATAEVWLYEHEFYARFADSDGFLTHEQKNAIAALYSVRCIRREYFAFEHIMNDPTVARILLETVVLTTAAMRGNFRVLLDRSESQRARLKNNSSKGVKARATKSEEKRRICRNLVNVTNDRSISEVALRIGRYIRSQKIFDPPPKHRAIMGYIKDLFPARVKKKPPPTKP